MAAKAAKEEAKLPEGITIIPPDREKVTYDSVLNINFYKKGAPFLGSIRGMRYRLIKDEIRGVPEGEEEEKVLKTRFKLSVWEEPLSYEDTEAAGISDYYFDFDEDGRKQAVDKINEAYQSEILHWHDAEENGIKRLLKRRK
ncbi:MAG: hypothetical protein IJU93_06635 [Lachnospiraceae bacterium]|nr:hypothetical protein [Lachnospiraceae bacterium]